MTAILYFIMQNISSIKYQQKHTFYKGQLISKRLFGIFNSPKKTNKKIQLYYNGNSSRNGFVRFLGELRKPKRHFEINWPLTQPTLKTIRRSYQDFLCWVVEFLPGVYKCGHLYKSYFVTLVVWLFVCICNLLIYIWTTSNTVVIS